MCIAIFGPFQPSDAEFSTRYKCYQESQLVPSAEMDPSLQLR